jgi:hypothetical protein
MALVKARSLSKNLTTREAGKSDLFRIRIVPNPSIGRQLGVRKWLKVSYELGLRPFCRCGDFSIPFLCGKDATPQTAGASFDELAAVLFEALLRRVCLKLCLNPSP